MQILSEAEVSRKIGLSRVSIWRAERRGEFPQRLRLSARRIGWSLESIEAWLSQRAQGIGAEKGGANDSR